MKIIYGGIGTGKTTALIEMAAKNGYYIVTHNKLSAEVLFNNSIKMGLTIPYPLTFKELENRDFYTMHMKGIVIDDADAFLQSLTNNLVKCISINEDELIKL